jgi:uncharacterized protein (DUF1697 family)
LADRYVALLRGINVGTAKRVAMAELRVLVEELGYGEVRTLLNSGNVVFSAVRLPAFRRSAAPTLVVPGADLRGVALRIEKALEAKLGVSARVMVISAEDLADVVRQIPWAAGAGAPKERSAESPLGKVADNPSCLLVGILGDTADREKLAQIVRKDWGKERIAVGAAGLGAKGSRGKGAGGAARAVYMWIPQGVIESRLNAAVNKALGEGVTARNWATVLKLKEMTEVEEG